MEKHQLSQWCYDATSKIRYFGDRKAVRQELLQHVEDKYDALEKAGIPQEEIPEQVLRAMGSAEEIAPQLAAIHRPFWGYFHFFSTTLLVLVLPVFLFVLVWQGFRFATDSIYKEPDYSNHAYDPYSDTSAPGMQRFYYAEPDLSYRDSGYIVKLTKLSCWGGAQEALHFRLDVTSYLPLCDHPDFCYYITLQDSLGNKYTPELTPDYGVYPGSSLYRDVVQTGHFSWVCDTRLNGFDFRGVKWIEICYTRDGRNMAMRIPIPGGDTP